jgi:hypothetical protein
VKKLGNQLRCHLDATASHIVTTTKSEYMRDWRARKEAEQPGYADRERAKARERARLRYEAMKHDPEFRAKERERNRLVMAAKRADPETRAALNARKRELAQTDEAKQKQAARMVEWRAKNSERIADYMRQWRDENAKTVAEYNKAYMSEYVKKPDVQYATWVRSLWKNYKMTPGEFNEMWSSQNGECAICAIQLAPRGRSADSVAVDHNHGNGAVRGLLCRSCNHGLGHFRDHPSILKLAAQYLEEKGYCEQTLTGV